MSMYFSPPSPQFFLVSLQNEEVKPNLDTKSHPGVKIFVECVSAPALDLGHQCLCFPLLSKWS